MTLNWYDTLEALLLTDPEELTRFEAVREAYEGLVGRFQRQPEEAKRIVAERFGLGQEERRKLDAL